MRSWVLLASCLLLLLQAGCLRHDPPTMYLSGGDGGQGCTCQPDCPVGRCDVEVTLDPACPRAVPLVVDRQVVGDLAPGETWSSCQQTWAVGQQVTLTVAAGSPVHFHETPSCFEDVDHIKAVWRCP